MPDKRGKNQAASAASEAASAASAAAATGSVIVASTLPWHFPALLPLYVSTAASPLQWSTTEKRGENQAASSASEAASVASVAAATRSAIVASTPPQRLPLALALVVFGSPSFLPLRSSLPLTSSSPLASWGRL